MYLGISRAILEGLTSGDPSGRSTNLWLNGPLDLSMSIWCLRPAFLLLDSSQDDQESEENITKLMNGDWYIEVLR